MGVFISLITSKYGGESDTRIGDNVVFVGDEDKKTIIGQVPQITATNSDELIDIAEGEKNPDLELKEESEEMVLPSIEHIQSIDEFSPEQASEIYRFLKSKYGNLFLKWEPETLETVIKDDFGLDDIPDEIWTTILAVRTVGVAAAWVDFNAFEKAAIALAGLPVYPDMVQHVTPEQMFRLYQFMKSVEPEGVLGDDVERYIAARMFFDEFFYAENIYPKDVQAHIYELGAPVELLKEVQKKLSNVNIYDQATLQSFVAGLSENAIDIQIARYLSLLT